MPYSEFTLKSACETFGLSLDVLADIHRGAPEVRSSSLLTEYLDEHAGLGTAINAEKSRSEYIETHVLAEVRRLAGRRISVFSGISFDVDNTRGLGGVCDFLLARSPNQVDLVAPAVAFVEAEREDIPAGFGQCAAEMVAARTFNEREGQGPRVIHGVVTTGSVWKFLKLDGGSLLVDEPEYSIARLDRLLGALLRSVGEGEPTPVLV